MGSRFFSIGRNFSDRPPQNTEGLSQPLPLFAEKLKGIILQRVSILKNCKNRRTRVILSDKLLLQTVKSLAIV